MIMSAFGECDGCGIRQEVLEVIVEENNQQRLILYCEECFKEINKVNGGENYVV